MIDVYRRDPDLEAFDRETTRWLMNRVQSITHPPKANFEDVLATFEHDETRDVLRQWHAGLKELTESFYYVSDLDDSEVYVNFYRVTGVSFRDTLETYTVEVDGKPQTVADIYNQLGRVNEATELLRREGKL
jgi:hypothetical protein